MTTGSEIGAVMEACEVSAGEALGKLADMGHAVQFYQDDAFLCSVVARFMGAGLAAGDPVVVIATDVHQEQFQRRLKENGIDVERAIANQRLVVLDARTTLAELMVGDLPDRERFRHTIGGVLGRIASPGRRVCAFGEMVDLLWRDGNPRAALRLEELWNEIGAEQPLSLLCGYLMSSFAKEEDRRLFERVCQSHCHIFPTESYAGIDDPRARLAEVSRLQHSARALALEIERRKHVETQLADMLSEQIKATRESEERYRFLIESVTDYAIFMLDREGRVATWNPGAELIKGYRESEIVGTHFSRFYPDEDARAGKCEHELAAAARDGRFEDEGWRVRKDGTRFWANVIISPVKNKKGELIGYSKVTRDLSERRRAEEERAARLVAEQANKTKDEFLAMLGHELRNPLAPIVTALQITKLRGESRSAKELQVIERQVKHMVRLVDDLLDISRITRGKIQLRKERLDLRDVVAKAIEIASPLLEQRRHHFDVDVPQNEIAVHGDEERLTQVFTNLLMNAAKYTNPGGHVVVSVRHFGREAMVEVKDDGVGIAAELLPRVFDLFVQGQQGVDRSHGGLGIGLSLVRTLVGMHGGVVEARSDGLDAGSTFTVKLPALGLAVVEAQSSGLGAMLETRTPDQRRVVVVVDDNRDAAELIAQALTSIGHEVRTAADGASALDIVRELEPDVALIDIGLPVIDGYELAARIRSELGPAGSGPCLIALTGYGQNQDRARSLAAGFDDHLVKPVDIGDLFERVARARKAKRRGAKMPAGRSNGAR